MKLVTIQILLSQHMKVLNGIEMLSPEIREIMTINLKSQNLWGTILSLADSGEDWVSTTGLEVQFQISSI